MNFDNRNVEEQNPDMNSDENIEGVEQPDTQHQEVNEIGIDHVIQNELVSQTAESNILQQQDIESQNVNDIESGENNVLDDANLNENENEGEPVNDPSGEDIISSLISSVSNSHLMSEENIEAIREVLCKKENVFYKLSPRDDNLQEELSAIIKWKAKIAENTIGQALNYYHQKLLDSELNHLDKLMKILKSNKREMYLRRLTVEHNKQSEAGDTQNDSDFPDNNQREFSMMNHENKRIGQQQTSKTVHSGVSLRDLLPEYDAQRKFIRFQLNDKYEVFLKAFEERNVKTYSLIDKIPQDVLQNHILIYFNSFDLFKVRGVCSEWRELIRGMWHIIFRREMMEQVIAADLCNDIEMNFKLMSVKSPFYQKFGIFMKAITEIIDWNAFQSSLISETADIKHKMLVVTFFRMIGMYVGFDKLSDFQEVYWDHFKEIASNHLKTFIDSLFHQEFQFKSNHELDIIKENFLDCPDISSFTIRQSENKNAIMFQLFLRQLLVFAQLKNFISLAQSYILIAKDKLKEVSKEWPHKKDFLEGAYKILLFKFVEIKNGEVAIVKEDNERRTGLLRNIQDELDECMNITTSIQDNVRHQSIDREANIFVNDPEPQNDNNHTAVQTNDPIEALPAKTLEEMNGNTVLNNEVKSNLDEQLRPANILNQNSKDKEQNFQDSGLEAEKEKLAEEKKEVIDKSTELKQKCNLNEQLTKIVQMKTNSSHETLEKFLKSQDPDYIIERNGSETRLYLDDMIKIEFLIQKVLKQHIMHEEHDCDCPLHVSPQENEEDVPKDHKNTKEDDRNNNEVEESDDTRQ